MGRRTEPQLKLYTTRELVAVGEPHVPMLNPFWGHGATVMDRPDFADRYARIGSDLFSLADRADADLCVFPVDWKRVRDTPERVDQAREFARRARPKPVVFFYSSDRDDAVPVDGATVFRTSMTRSGRRRAEFALPGFHEDLLEYLEGQLPLRERPTKPVVSFCGFVLFEEQAETWRGALRTGAAEVRRVALERLDHPSSRDVYVRARAIEALLRQRRYVETSFILHSQGGGGAWSTPGAPGIRSWEDARRTYVRSIVESDYVLCVRGIGNWSYRLYETLCLGRIPVFVDTDCVLPYDFAIDWRDHVVWITRPQLTTIGERIAEFHKGLTADQFVQRQQAARKLWENYLSPEGFFSNFHRHFA